MEGGTRSCGRVGRVLLRRPGYRQEWGGSNRKSAGDDTDENGGDGAEGDSDDESDGGGLGIVLGTVLDGVPESAVLGMSLVGGAGVSVSLLAGIWVSNFPESLGSTVNMVKAGWAKSKIRMLWWAPEAYDRSQVYAGLATVAGFALAVWLTTME